VGENGFEPTPLGVLFFLVTEGGRKPGNSERPIWVDGQTSDQHRGGKLGASQGVGGGKDRKKGGVDLNQKQKTKLLY